MGEAVSGCAQLPPPFPACKTCTSSKREGSILCAGCLAFQVFPWGTARVHLKREEKHESLKRRCTFCAQVADA